MTHSGADEDWCEILLDGEVFTDKPPGASGKGGDPLPAIANDSSVTAKATAKCVKTVASLYSGKRKVKHTLSCATQMGRCARPPRARSWTAPWTPLRH